MDNSNPVRVGLVGCGGIARHHIRQMLKQTHTTQIVAINEPAASAYEQAAALFKAADLETPPNQPDLDKLLRDYELDAVLITTPHAYHHDQAKMCLEKGLDVLLEKPMVMTAAEAQSLLQARDKSGKLLTVAFQGSLSPQVRTAVKMLRAGDLGEILNINAMTWQNWGSMTVNTWRQQPEISGGGFLFDTGAHMLNTVSDLAGEDFAEVAALLDPRGRPVDVLGVVMARLKSGALVTLNACGETILSCNSDIWVFCRRGILRTGQWGERLELQCEGDPAPLPVEVPASLGVWEQFLAVRNGTLVNPSPPEIGLRMARLWDAIKRSASERGNPVQVAY